MCPKISAPTGRITNETAIVLKEASVAPAAPSGSKNSGPTKNAEKYA